jgi:4-hydroxybenzoyl-CoA reductase alpha subunit
VTVVEKTRRDVPPPPEAEELSVVGKPLPKVDAEAKVRGRHRYADDLRLPRMLIGKLLRSTRPHALITRIDVGRALELPGVHAVLTGKHLPIPYGILPVSQDEHALALEKVRYVGEPVAAVAAIDEETAERALALIDVEYEDLPAVMSIPEALLPDRPLIRGEGEGAQVDRVAALDFGDVDAGFEEADHVREDVLFYEGSTHMPLEEHSALAVWEGGRLTITTSTQNPHYVHRTLAKVLEVPTSQVRVIAAPVGGGFGGKCDPFSHELVAAKLAEITDRPVKITLDREEVFYTHRGRHPVLMEVRSGFTEDGRMTALSFRNLLDGGGFGSYGAATTYYTGALQPTTYRVPAYRFEAARLLTNKPPCGPKRGHGTPQPRYALECHLDKVAEDLGLDPVELRLRNAIEPFSQTVNHLRITSCGLRECVDTVVEASGFLEKHGRLPRGHGVGFAVSGYLCGAGLPIYFNDMSQSEVQIKVDRGGGVTVYSMATDIGQGSSSVLTYLVAEVLGIRPEEISIVIADTDLTPIDLGSYSSRVTFMAGNAAVQAAERMKALILEAAAEKLETHAEQLVLGGGRVFDRDDPDTGLDWEHAVQAASALRAPLVTSGSYRAPDVEARYRGAGIGPSPAYSYTAAVVELECDVDTGIIAVDQVWIAHDIGRAINPLLVIGQVEGGVYMALGEALYEQQTFRDGLLYSTSLFDYKSPTVLEMPEVHTYLVETIDPNGPFGAKEAGQGPLLPVVPAVANAVHDALGIRIDEVPITPEKVLRALDLQGRGKLGRVGPKAMPEFDFPEPYRVDPPVEALP